MIFSVCAGILIGLKLYYELRGKRFKNKEKRKREAKEEHSMRQVKSYVDYQKACAEKELLKKELETLLEKEKYKAKERDNYISTKYITAYNNGTSTHSGTKIYEVGKVGDATKEVYKGTGNYSWSSNSDYFNFIYLDNPFSLRGD